MSGEPFSVVVAASMERSIARKWLLNGNSILIDEAIANGWSETLYSLVVSWVRTYRARHGMRSIPLTPEIDAAWRSMDDHEQDAHRRSGTQLIDVVALMVARAERLPDRWPAEREALVREAIEARVACQERNSGKAHRQFSREAAWRRPRAGV